MNNLTTEQIIKTKAPGLSIVFKAVMIIACILAVTTIPQTYALGVILLAILVIATVIVFKYYNAEYEYSLVDNDMTVDKIMSRSMRKRCGVYNIARAELIAPAGSQDALRMEHRKLRTADYTSNQESDNIVVVYTMDNSNEMVRIFIEPDDRMKAALKAAAPRNAYKCGE